MDIQGEDTVAALLKLLEDNPEPQRFCFYKATQGSEHQCTPQQTSSMPQTNTVLVDGTPIQLKKVLSPHNLEMDSDTSSVAAWSFSMATPTTAPLGGAEKAGGSCSYVNLSLMSAATTNTAVDEDSAMTSEDEEGISSADESILKLLGNEKSDHCKTLLKIKDNMLIKNKSVARALFPAKEDSPEKTSPLKSQQRTTPATTTKCASFDPCRLFSPIPSIISPLVHHHQHAKITDRTPRKEESDQSIVSVSLFETPGKDGVVRDDGDTTSCSQELFGSPEILTPAQVNHQSEQDTHTGDHLSKETSSPQDINKHASHTHEHEPIRFSGFKEEVTNTQQNQHSEAINQEQQTPLLIKGFGCEPHLLPHSTPLSSLTQPGTLHNSSAQNAFPHSSTQPQTGVPITPLHTPLCSTAQPRSSCQPSQDANQTPNVPLILAKEPNPVTHSEHPLAPAENATMQTLSKTPAHEKRSNEQNYSFGSVGDVMDMLFMSSSQLDAHLSAHRLATECEPTKTIVKEQDTISKQVLSVSQIPPSGLGKSEATESVQKQKGDGVSLATSDTREDSKSNCVISNTEATKDVQLNTEEPAKATRKGISNNLRANAFCYPSKQKSNLKRKKSNIRTREYSVHQKSPEVTDTTKIEDEEPLAKRPCIHDDSDHVSTHTSPEDQMCIEKQTNNDVTRVEESTIGIEHLNKEKSPLHETEMDIDVNEKKVCFEEHLKEKDTHSGCSTNILSKQSQGDLKVNEVVEEGYTTPISSENPVMASLSIRPPGLRRTNKKSKASVVIYPSVKELKTPDATEGKAEAMEYLSGVRRHEELLADASIVKNSVSKILKVPPSLGFQTASGSSITVSEQAMKIAHQLVGTECELEGSHPTKSPETPKLIPPMHLTTTRPALTTTPSVALNQTREVNLNPDTLSTPAPFFTSPLLSESGGNPMSSAATFPRRPNRCPSKPFKVPRKAIDVSAVEEQASVARILRSFGAATDPAVHKPTRSRLHRQPIETGFQTAGGSRITVSSDGMEKAQKFITEDKENGMSTDTGSPLLDSSRKQPHLVTGFKTASGLKLVVSSEAMEKAEKDIAEEQRNDSSTDTNRGQEKIVTGFKTAGGSRLMVSSEAMKVAQKRIDEDQENGIRTGVCSPLLDPIRKKEQVVTGFKTASGKGLSASASSMAKAAMKFEEDSATPNTDSAIGVQFQMASGKSVNVSATSMLRAKSLLSFELGLDAEDKESDHVMPTSFQPAGGRDVSVSSKSLKCAKNLIEEEEDNLQLFDDIKTSLFQSPLNINLQEETRENARVMTGFSTARGSSISVSRISLQEYEKLIETDECDTSIKFNDCTTAAAVESGGSPCSLTAEDVETFGTFTQMNFEKQSPKSPDRNDLSLLLTVNTIHTPSDSTTGNEGLKKECDKDDGAEVSGDETADHCCFFSTQVVKQLTDFSSEEEMSCGEESDAASAAQNNNKQATDTVDTNSDDGELVGDQEQCHGDVQSQSQHNEMGHHGDSPSREEDDSIVVQQAGAEVVDLLSESMLLREFHEAETNHQNVDESTLEVNLSGELSESMIENMEISITLQPITQEQVTTTKVRVVNAVSDSRNTSTSQTVPRMSHMETSVHDQQSLPSLSQLSPPDPSQVPISRPSVLGHSPPESSLPDPSRSSLPGPSQPSLPGPSQPSLLASSQSLSAMTQLLGLQTKQVHIPESAVKLAKQVLGSSSSDPASTPVHDNKPICSSSLLQTASGKPVHVSEASLKVVRSVLGDSCEPESAPSCHSSQKRAFEHRGLQTASGKKVEVSESALLAVKKLLGSSSDKCLPSNTTTAATSCDSPQPHPIGLMTAGGRKVEISEEALAAVRSSSGAASMNTSLQTASGNKVESSEKSIRAAKLLLNSDSNASGSTCNTSIGSGFPGLCTASGTKVAISQKSLEAARATLDDKTPPSRTPNQNKSSSGLMTASGSNVSISEESLQAARAMLGSTSTANDHHNDFPSISTQSAPRVDSFITRTFSNSQSFAPPVTTPSSSFPGAPTRKYKPIFRPGGARSGGGHASVSSRMYTNPSTLSDTGVQQQLETQSRPGVISTPEGTLYDRRQPPGRRPLLPKQSHLDRDGAYIVRNTAVNFNRSSDSLNSQVRSQSTQSHPNASSSVIFKTPHRNMAALSHTQAQSSSFSRTSGPGSQGSSISSQSPLTTPRRIVAPSPSYYQRSSYSSRRPAWRGAGHASKRGMSTSTSVTPKTKFHDHKPTDQNSWQVSDSLSCSNTVAGSTNVMECAVNQTSKQLPSSPKRVQTSTQLTELGDKSTFDTPLSPLQITLSQICAMENSQALGTDTTATAVELTCEESAAKSSTTATTVEDSGYMSREASTVQTPSPHANNKMEPSHSVEKKLDESEKIMKSDRVGIHIDIDEDTLLAEAELDGLNDSLEELDNEGEVVVGPSSQKRQIEQAPDHQQSTKSQSSPCIHQTASTGGAHHTGIVKPQMGSLLFARLNNARIPLEHAVGYRPPGGFTLSQLHSLGVSEDTLLIRTSNAADFAFSGAQYFSSAVLSGSHVCIGDGAMLKLSSDGRAGVLEFWEAFRALSCVDEKLISYEWFVNHYTQLVWKLASMEVCYPQQFGGRCLTPDWLMLQLKYRYDREIDRAERSALHKICENDDVPSRRMVFCVRQIHREKLMAFSSSASIGEGAAAKGTSDMETGNETVIQSETTKESKSNVPNNVNPPCIELTDGWYSVPCALDPPLKQMVKSGKITVGTKLLVYGAELIGQSNPAHPLEMPPGCYLRISANSTRRARWFAKLGYQPMPRSFPVPLLSVFPDGGLVGCTDVVIARVYPMAYLEKREGKKSVLRSERMEQKVAALHEAERQRKIDSICSKVQKEFEGEVAKQDCPPVSRRRSRRLNTLQIKQLHDGEEIYNALSNAPDPQAFQEILSHTQIILLESYRQSLVSRRQEELQSRIRDAVKEAEEQLPQERRVTPLLRMRIVPSMTSDGVPRLRGDVSTASDCHLSVWRPTDELRQLLKEGCSFRVTNLTAYPSRFKHLQLTATRSSHYQPLNSQEPSSFHSPRAVTPISQLHGLSMDQLAYREVDTVGIVVCTISDHVMSHDLERDERQVDSVFIADSEGCLMVIRIWDGLKSQGLEETVKPGSVLALSNLSYRGLGHTHNLPTCNAGDCAVFSQKPREPHLKDALADLNSNIPSRKDRLKFLQTLEDEISSYL